MIRPSFSAFVVVALLSSAAHAAQQSNASDGMGKCHAVVDNSERLACYDTFVTAFEASVSNHDIVIMDRETIRQTRRGLFGYTLPKAPLFNGDNVRDNISELDTTVSSETPLGNGKWKVRLAEGSLWETTESVGWVSPRSGSKIHLKAGAFGSYFMTIDRDNPIRAMRVG